jgi:hypothetical protein
MKKYYKFRFKFYLLCCLCLLIGCDHIFKRQVIIDFQNNKAKSFTVADPGDFNELFSRIDRMAQKNGLRCKPYNAVRKSYRCVGGTVSLAVYVTSEKTVRIELTQFGPWDETEEFIALEKDLSNFIKEEFPGQSVQITNPIR